MTALYLAYFAKRSREILQYRWECNFMMSICRMIFLFPVRLIWFHQLKRPTKKNRSKHFDLTKRVGKRWLFPNKISWQESMKSVCTADHQCSDCITNQTSSFTFHMLISTFLFSFDFLCWYSVLLNIRFNERQVNSQMSRVYEFSTKKVKVRSHIHTQKKQLKRVCYCCYHCNLNFRQW